MIQVSAFLVFLWAYCGLSPLLAQSVFEGYVLDTEEATAIPNAQVYASNKLLATTDASGYFRFMHLGDTLRVSISATGYLPLRYLLRGDATPAQIYLAAGTLDLAEVLIKAYESNKRALEVPAAISRLDSMHLNRFGNASWVSALNTLPGVRMEERSPGSYRLSIRGSSLRSPFGVRNVKVYWNDLPLTDAGGNTYLNALDFNQITQMEVLRGPAGSLYGAGTGGALLLQNQWDTTTLPHTTVLVGGLLGDYGLWGANLQLRHSQSRQYHHLTAAHQQADGYREHSAMRRAALQWRSEYHLNQHRRLYAQVFYSDLMYDTPGGLTPQQYASDPRQARPRAGLIAGAAEQQARIMQGSLYIGLGQEYRFNRYWTNRTGVFALLNRVENPSIRNYELRHEPNIGIRSTTSYQWAKGKIVFGTEIQKGTVQSQVHGNKQGQRDTLQTNDRTRILSALIFAQAEFDLPAQWLLTVGSSLNYLSYQFRRDYPQGNTPQRSVFTPVLVPRIALSKALRRDWYVFASLSQGFSPPTIAEVRPSDNIFNTSLQAEMGLNMELGSKVALWQGRLRGEIAAFQFALSRAIVVRRTIDGADFFTNAGDTRQRGVEAQLNAVLCKHKPQRFLSQLSSFATYTYYDFRFQNYQRQLSQTTLADFSGNWYTGAPAHTLVLGVDAAMRWGIGAHLTWQYTDKIYLNDANTFYAEGYSLLGARLDWQRTWRSYKISVWLGVDNALDATYSLGNDLNALGNRFFNVAPGRNYFGGWQVCYRF